MLSLARLESGQEVYDHAPLALGPVVESCVESHRDRADAKGLALTLELGPLDDQTQIRADEEAVRQILDNLIDNAIKYTPAGGSVRVTCVESDDDIIVEVADSGIGIPRDDLPAASSSDFIGSIRPAAEETFGGTGLGLSIVKHLVQSIGGQIKRDQSRGGGKPVCGPVAEVRTAGPARVKAGARRFLGGLTQSSHIPATLSGNTEVFSRNVRTDGAANSVAPRLPSATRYSGRPDQNTEG